MYVSSTIKPLTAKPRVALNIELIIYSRLWRNISVMFFCLWRTYRFFERAILYSHL